MSPLEESLVNACNTLSLEESLGILDSSSCNDVIEKLVSNLELAGAGSNALANRLASVTPYNFDEVLTGCRRLATLRLIDTSTTA